MAVVGGDPEVVYLDTTFDGGAIPGGLTWFHSPSKSPEAGPGGKGLTVHADAHSDFWQKTYYTPLLVKDNGHFLHVHSVAEKVVMETSFDLHPINQFDQAGLTVRIDEDHWIKTVWTSVTSNCAKCSASQVSELNGCQGIEYADGVSNLSVVVTNVYSDWSTTKWAGDILGNRIYRLGNSYVIEHKEVNKDEWTFFRICHLNNPSNQPIMMGLFACSPTKEGATVNFEYLTLKSTKGISHHN